MLECGCLGNQGGYVLLSQTKDDGASYNTAEGGPWRQMDIFNTTQKRRADCMEVRELQSTVQE